MRKSHIYILAVSVILIIFGIGAFIVLQQQINVIDRKLNCILASTNTILGYSMIPGLKADDPAVQEQFKLIKSACDASYVLFGLPK